MIAAALLFAMAQGPAQIEALGWLEGHWRTEGPQPANALRFTEEQWTSPLAGAMFGVGRTIRAGRTASFEYMRIVEEGGRLVFVGQPEGAAGGRFPAISAGPREIVFANPAHDYPQRIRYAREGDRITATISLMNGSRPVSWSYRLMAR